MISHASCKLSEHALLNAWHRGDFAHVGELFWRHRRIIQWTAFYFGGDQQDVFQRTVVHAMRHHDRFRGSSAKAFGSWLSNIARNLIQRDRRDHARRDRRLRDLAYLLKVFPVSLIPEPDEPESNTLAGQLWTDREIHTLRGAWPELGRSVILELLPGRSWASIEHKAAKLGLVRRLAA